MIPLRLTLKNFLSYQSATLDFRGLHTACICGPNGSGKSSLLEGIAWALWGESRAATEEDVMHLGEKETQVDYWFQLREQTYRVIRTRVRGQATTLEFQVLTEAGLKTLTGRGVRATQELILQALKLDYETFVNSAYLRQGRADEFMLKRPSERKQILTDLLKLDHYEYLAEQAKDRAKTCKVKVDLLAQSLATIAEQLQQREAIASEQAQVQQAIHHLRQLQADLQAQIQKLQAIQQQRQTWQQEQQWYQQQHQAQVQAQQQIQTEIQTVQAQKTALAAILQQEAQILAGYSTWQQLQQDEEIQAQRFETFQTLQAQRQTLVQQQNQQLETLKDQWRTLSHQLQSNQQLEQELTTVVQKAPEIEAAIASFQQAKVALATLDQLQVEFSPLQQRHQNLQIQINQAQAQLLAKIEALKTEQQTLVAQQQQQPDLIASDQIITQQIAALDNRRIYHQRVREKGQERRAFLEQLQARLADHEKRLQILETQSRDAPLAESHCPLCDSPLDAHHWQQVQAKHQLEQQDLRNQIWVLREQLAVSEREITILRQEYREVEQELAPYGSLLERRGQLQAHLAAIASSQIRCQQIDGELAQLQADLTAQAYAVALHQEKAELDAQLQSLNYDDRNHALARGEVERWRWAELKQSELRQAQQKLQTLRDRRPALEQQHQRCQAQIDQLLGQGAYTQNPAPLHRDILALSQQITALDYDPNYHNALRVQVRQAQQWQWRYQELQQAQAQMPQIQERLDQLQQSWQGNQQAQQELTRTIQSLTQKLQDTPDARVAISTMETQQRQQHQQLEQALAQAGRLQQQIIQLQQLQVQQTQQQQELQHSRHQHRIYQELGQAFGKNGIQALMIENVLPQLEAEANLILNRLSGNQLHIQFVTQKASKRDQARRKRSQPEPTKLIDTLDILIADLAGTRPYETYSGGEAFRVNFAIRLALARLLAQRSGTALQMLIIDEGFGTQDPEGCDRLIASINAIAPDFACILVVTHMPHFKEAFQTRIEVTKTPQGSQLLMVH